MYEDRALAEFRDKRNIKLGRARVIWADRATDVNGRRFEAGWVLPGGMRTTDSLVAYMAAQGMDEMLRAA